MAQEAAGLPPPQAPVSPQESLKYLVCEPGLTVELVAHEPNIIDPVALRFDEKGRMWVVEMRDYPTVETKGIEHRSRISILDDRDGDGFYEQAIVFADNLPYATGLQPWQGGAFVTMAGQVAYLRDHDGDDQADEIKPWYTGFAQKNTQLRANHPQLALDNHIYIANGLRGGEIVSQQRPGDKPLSISGRDFRFNPLTREFEAVSGMGQFGLTFDDYGNRFVCTNRNPAIHVVLDEWQLRKNPLVAVSAVTTDVAPAEANSRVFAIGPSWTTSHLHAGQFTAACGVHIYRGDALPREYYGNLFVCEPTGHLVHREIMEPRGVTFASRPAEQGKEFLASRDGWFSPVNLEIGPDGALYVVDMYRKVIEHPEWMPSELRERPDLAEGNDRGRIYRIMPRGFDRRRAADRFSPRSVDHWVELLAHPNAWWRETAARLLLERQDKSLGEKLRRLALHQESHLARIHALWLLNSLDLLDDDVLSRLLDDAHPRVVEQAIVAAAPRISESSRVRERIARLAGHEDARVRFQAMLTAQRIPAAPRFAVDRWEQEAMLIAAGDRGGEALAAMLQHPHRLAANVRNAKQFVARLAQVAAASKNEQQQITAVSVLMDHAMYSRAGLAALFSEMGRGGTTVSGLRAKLDDQTNRTLDQLFHDSRRIVTDTRQPEELRLEAVALLAFAESAAEILRHAALEDPSQEVRVQAVEGLARQSDIEPWRAVLERYAGQTPAVRRAILTGALGDAQRARLFLGELAAGHIQLTEVDWNHAKLLLQKMYGEAIPSDREQALADYRVVLGLKSDAARGRAVFEKNCASCHRVAGIGVDVAPDISDSRERSFEQLLVDIIQPNRAIDANYFSYTVTTLDGMIHTGVLATETSTSVTLKQAEGKEIIFRREEIEEMRSDGISFMPDGLEKNIPPQDMADLIGFIKHWRYLEAEQELPVGGR